MPKVRKTTAHSAAQLREALEFTPDQWGMARTGGLIAEPDLKTPRWSGPVVDELVTRREQLLAGLPDFATSAEVMQATLACQSRGATDRCHWLESHVVDQIMAICRRSSSGGQSRGAAT